MKSVGFVLSYLGTAQARRSLRILGWMVAIFVVVVAVYSTLFHEIMDHEGQRHSWPTAVYWTVVTMSTLGYGDIAFTSDLGRTFSVVVLLSGSVFILVLLPFTFIQFVFVPWMESTQRARAPRRLGDDVAGHVILTGLGPIEQALIERLRRAGTPYVVVVSDIDEALRLHDDGIQVLVGEIDDPATYEAAALERASLVAATAADTTNTNIAFTVREISESVNIVATATSAASVDILQLAGCNEVLQLGELLGAALARRVLMPDGRPHVVGRFGDLLIAEAVAPPVAVDRPLQESKLRQLTGVTVAGVWDRGELAVARPSTVLRSSTILVVAGSREQLDAYSERFGSERAATGPVIILGGGRVGRAAGRALAEAGVEYVIVEQRQERVRDSAHYVVGDAADLAVLEAAGIQRSPSVIVTTHDDDVNIYLTIYCRQLRPDIQIIARARLERNVTTLHRAGADFVMSYASTGATAMWNVLSADNTLQLAEGLDVFRVELPASLVGKSVRDAHIRDLTGCTVVATAEGQHFAPNPDPDAPLAAGTDLVLIGDDAAEQRFLERYRQDGGPAAPARGKAR